MKNQAGILILGRISMPSTGHGTKPKNMIKFIKLTFRCISQHHQSEEYYYKTANMYR